MSSTVDERINKEIEHQKILIKARLYYDKNRERILAKRREEYYRKKEEFGLHNQKRGRKPKPRDEIQISVRV